MGHGRNARKRYRKRQLLAKQARLAAKESDQTKGGESAPVGIGPVPYAAQVDERTPGKDLRLLNMAVSKFDVPEAIKKAIVNEMACIATRRDREDPSKARHVPMKEQIAAARVIVSAVMADARQESAAKKGTAPLVNINNGEAGRVLVVEVVKDGSRTGAIPVEGGGRGLLPEPGAGDAHQRPGGNGQEPGRPS